MLILSMRLSKRTWVCLRERSKSSAAHLSLPGRDGPDRGVKRGVHLVSGRQRWQNLLNPLEPAIDVSDNVLEVHRLHAGGLLRFWAASGSQEIRHRAGDPDPTIVPAQRRCPRLCRLFPLPCPSL
jgi:hypothetical protein